VYVGCTNNGVQNCGLMQAYAGSVSFDPNNPQGSITQMIIDGTQGTAQGGGLVQWFNNENVGANTGGNPYNVLRGYNSGSINFNDLNDPQGATASYVSDVANRLQVSLLFRIEEHETNEARDGMVMMVTGTELLVAGGDEYLLNLNTVVCRRRSYRIVECSSLHFMAYYCWLMSLFLYNQDSHYLITSPHGYFSAFMNRRILISYMFLFICYHSMWI
jgi:hypothetical protein